MSQTHDPHRPSFSFGNPFKMMLHKGSYLSLRHLALLEIFEGSLAARFKKLQPKDKNDVLSLPYMTKSLQLLSETHNDIKSFITDLKLPVCGWDNKWIDVYLENSLKLLDISIAFTSEISRLSQCQLSLRCCLHDLSSNSSVKPSEARSLLDCWRQSIRSKNLRIESSFSVLDELAELLHLPKVKNSLEGKLLMRALYGVKVQSLFICSILIAAFSGSTKKLMELPVPEEHMWASAFLDLQSSVNGEIRRLVGSGRSILVKELELADVEANSLLAALKCGGDIPEPNALQSSIAVLRGKAYELTQGLDSLTKEVNGFFQVVLTGRDALLSNLRVGSDFSKSSPEFKVQQSVR
ncbi:hypothetical protein Droror1_Dr00004881 [Drosera rotundifolia]